MAVLAIIGLVLSFYQNCAPVNFKGASHDLGSTALGEPIPPAPVYVPSDLKISISPLSDLDFGKVLLNTTSSPQSITITNETPDDDAVITIESLGEGRAFFTMDSSACAPSLAPRKSCTVPLRFTAANLLEQKSLIRVSAVKKSDAMKGMVQEFQAKGIGFSDLAFDLANDHLDFGNNVIMNTESGVQTVTITNRTPSDAISISVTPASGAPFVVDSSACQSVPINGSCALKFRFTPTGTEPEKSVVEITAGKANDLGTPKVTRTLTLTGAGATDLNFELLTTSLDFQKVRLNTTQTKSVLVRSRTPSEPIQISAVVPGSDFVLDLNSPCLKTALAPNATCELWVRFSPTVTSLKTSSLQVSAAKLSEPAVAQKKTVSLSGSGFIISPSSMDELFLVGWYSHKELANVSFFNRTADNGSCPSVVWPPAGTKVNMGLYQAQQVEFCYEPSGAHGLQLASTPAELDAAGTKLKNFILKDSAFNAVPTLDELFATPADHTSTNIQMKEATYFYTLGYLNIPREQHLDPQFDVQFNVHFVDDAIGMVINNRFAGYVGIMETWGTRVVRDPVLNVDYQDYPDKDFPVSLKTGKDNSKFDWRGKNNLFSASPLREGANTVIGIWLDDSAKQRNIVGARVQFKSSGTAGVYQNVPVFLPNVIQGYVYNGITGAPLSGATVQVADAGTRALIRQTTTDAKGFYRLQEITDGNRILTFSKSGYQTAQEMKILNHREASTAILDVSKGL